MPLHADDLITSLKMAAARNDDLSVALDAVDYIERLRAALKPFAQLFLFPDDIGKDTAQDFRSDPDWSEAHNDMTADDLYVKRGHIRAARNALKGM
jgi:hypothetical protein